MAFNQAYGTLQDTECEMSYNQAYGTAHNMSYNEAHNTTTSFIMRNRDALDSSHRNETVEGIQRMGLPPPNTVVSEDEDQRSSEVYETIPGENPLYDN